MAMASERSKPLHNFSLPCLKWGNQRILKCMKVDSNGRVTSANESESEDLIGRRRESEFEKRRSSNGSEGFRRFPLRVGASGGDDGIEAMREKLMFDLRSAAEKMKVKILEEGEDDESSVAAARPWNLRTRRAACKAPTESRGGGGGGVVRNEERKQNYSPMRIETPMKKSVRPKDLAATPDAEKKEKVKFWNSLSRKEIEEDFLAMTGTKPSRRPKKRPKIVQKQLDSLLPGRLSEITPDAYKVPDLPEPRKRSK